MFKNASKLKLRFSTSKGNLTVEQLWDLSLEELDSLAVRLEKEYKESKGKSFLVKKTSKDARIKLRFNIVLEVLEAKVEENEAAQLSLDNKAKKERLLSVLAKRQDESLENMSEEQIKKELKKLEQ